MKQYLLLIHKNTGANPTDAEWETFFDAANRSGMFRGGSELGRAEVIGKPQSMKLADHLAGYMRFDSDDREKIISLLQLHPTVIHGGTVELCEMPKS